MKFEIKFHTPFRVASGHASDGSDTTVDGRALLPASSLKGLMRSAARDLLKFPPNLIEGVFGAAWHPSPWSWSDALISGAPTVRARARVRIEAMSSTVARGALLIADEVLADAAEFSVDRSGWIEPSDTGTHETVLMAAARAVTAVGGDRRRGLGWVTITPVEPSWSHAYLSAAIALVHGHTSAGSESAGGRGAGNQRGPDHG